MIWLSYPLFYMSFPVLSEIEVVMYGSEVEWRQSNISQAGSFWNEKHIPDSKVHGANMGPTWVMSAPDEPHISPMNLAIRDVYRW